MPKTTVHTPKVEKLYRVLSDGKWHSTRDLVRRVGHSFSVSKFRLIQYGHVVEKRPHPTKRWQWEYRLLD